MSKASKEFFEQAKNEAKPMLPGLSLSKILSDVGEELKHLGKQGAHELAAALFNGSPFVMYPRHEGSVEDPQHGLPEQQKEVDREMSM